MSHTAAVGTLARALCRPITRSARSNQTAWVCHKASAFESSCKATKPPAWGLSTQPPQVGQELARLLDALAAGDARARLAARLPGGAAAAEALVPTQPGEDEARRRAEALLSSIGGRLQGASAFQVRGTFEGGVCCWLLRPGFVPGWTCAFPCWPPRGIYCIRCATLHGCTTVELPTHNHPLSGIGLSCIPALDANPHTPFPPAHTR